MRRNRRAGVEDRWTKTVRDDDNNETRVPTARNGKGLRWMARYVADDGRERTKSFGRKADAQNWLNKEISGQVTGTWTDPDLSTQTFGAVAEKWIATKANRKPKTVAGYRSLLDTVILPRWEDVPLRDVRYDDMQVWVSGLSVKGGSTRFAKRGLSASRVIQAHQVVGAVMKFAVRSKYLAVNPAEGIDLPDRTEVEQRYLSHEQAHRLAVASGHYRTFVLVLAYCGLRFGEAAALRVGSVDLKARRITVSRSVTYVTGQGQVEGAPKNRTSRKVPVPKFLVPLLRTEIGVRGAGELVFPGREGSWLTEGQVRWVFDTAAEAIGEKGLTPHELRHTCASLAIQAGGNVKVLQTLLGHKTATLTLDRYGHLFPDDLDRIADSFDSAADQLRTEKGLRLVGDAD
ncbi:site-specific integrase [Gordonia sp. ABSL49_1]|uniref:tyrosine-type recombinase/integrase n=1 Tax=Gordonia sp. ABSL49_1 TaxID=2920941 RepID=UPI001F0FD53E|nr:site-specific integrase [Gordonia sp. ABSL49_1]MCH5641425.1 site-specific integrase [Gordonia sp. ABSL49_1]